MNESPATMKLIPEESKPGQYEIYHHSNGKKYVVIEGLNPTDIHEPGLLEQWTQKHYQQLEAFYWVLFFATFTYLILTYTIFPLVDSCRNKGF